MNETLAFYASQTVAGFPLGKPLDGRDRYGMTPEQATVYNWLVKYRPHDRTFAVSFHQIATAMLTGKANIHARVAALVERGWLTREDAGYRFVQPVMIFKDAQ